MFEKLLSQLPYNPGLAHQMAFYSRRMREEAAIRRTGMIFIVLAFLVQFFTVLSPPQPSVAASNSDLINGGISGPADAKRACNNNTQNYANIMNNYGISCADIGNASTVTLRSTGRNKQLFSMGRIPYGARNPSSHKVTSETPVNGFGAGTLYWRYLWSFDTGAYSDYQALQLSSSRTGKTFWILYNCGNLVSVGVPQAVAPQPAGGIAQIPKPKPTPKPTPKPKTPASPTATPAPTPTVTPTPTPTPCQYDSSITADNSSCKPCEESQSSQDATACVIIYKTASDTTQNLADANNATAQPDDTIVYTLYAKNNGKADVKDYVFEENLSDAMDYASPTDLHGGSIDTNNIVTWPALTIKAGATAKQQITVKVKNPIPQTPASASDPGHFDLIMTNVYGNTINIHVPGSPAKTVEAAGASLPNTGPGSSIAVGALILIVGGYFYSRSRLLAKESNIALHESINV